MKDSEDINTMTAHLFRENSGKMAAVLTRMFGISELDNIMDIIQDTFESALTQWRFKNIPDNPSGWLMQVAKNKAINHFKREHKTSPLPDDTFLEKHDTGIETDIDKFLLPAEIEDSQLRLLMACCHPDFSEKNQIIITLHVLCGFGISEIANALLMNNEAVKKALQRTKAELKQSGHIIPSADTLKQEKRIETVQTILYLVFNEGYKSTRSTNVINNDLCYESIRLTWLLLKPETPMINESRALLALMFFNLSRFPSRLNSEGEILSLEEQDRQKWDKIFIEEGYHYLNMATQSTTLTRYHLEAIIASLHCKAAHFEDTDWNTIVYLYKQLEKIAPSSMLTLNRILAESYIPDATDNLQMLNALKQDNALQNHYLLYAAEGDILQRSGQLIPALSAFTKALQLANAPLDKRFLQRKIRQCQSN